MPIITEITDSLIERENDNSNRTSHDASNNLKQWMHLNSILNCKSTVCKTYKMIQKHLLQLRKIDENDMILIPSDYQIGNYSDAILTIICAYSESCNPCLKLLDHLSCHKRYCNCNSYKDICNQQVHLRHTVEQSSTTKNCLNMYNIRCCSTSTKEKIKSLVKYHEGAIKVMRGLIDSTPVADSLVDKSTESEISDDSMKNQSVKPSSSKWNTNSIGNIKPIITSKSSGNSAKGDVMNSYSDEVDSTINSSYDITPYQAETSQTSDISHLKSFLFSDESFIGSSDDDDDSDSDEPNFISSSTTLNCSHGVHSTGKNSHSVNRGFPYCSTTTTASLNNSWSSISNILEDDSSDSDVDFESHKHTRYLDNNADLYAQSYRFGANENLTASSEGPEVSVSVTDSSNNSCGLTNTTRSFFGRNHGDSEVFINIMNSTADTTGFHSGRSVYRHQTNSASSDNCNKYRKHNVICDSIFSDESFIDDESDSCSDVGEEKEFSPFNINSYGYSKRRNKSIAISVFSDENQIEYSSDYDNDDDDMFNFCHHPDGERRSDSITEDFQSLDSTAGVVIVDVTDKDKSEVDKLLQGTSRTQKESSSTYSGFKYTSKIVSAATSSRGIEFHSADTTSTNESSNAFSSPALDSGKLENVKRTISQLHEVSQSSDVQKPKRKRFRKKRVSTVRKLQQKRTPRQNITNAGRGKKNKKNMNNNVQGRLDGPSSSGYAIQNNVSNKTNNAHSTKTSAFGDINYSYVRNVLALQNAQIGSSRIEQHKYQSKKTSPYSNKRKMKLYDSSSWIESSNYDQLCHNNET